VTRNTRWQTVRFRIVLRKMAVHHCLACGVERDLFALGQSEVNVFDQENIAGTPQAGEIGAAAGELRNRTRGRRRTPGLSAGAGLRDSGKLSKEADDADYKSRTHSH